MTPRKRQQEPPATEPRAQDQEATAGSGDRKPLREMTIKEIQEGYNDLTEEEQARVQKTALKFIQATQGTENTGEIVQAAGEFLANTAQLIQEAAQKALEALEQFSNSELWQKLQAEYPGISENTGIIVSFMADDLIKYAPEIKRQMQEYETEDGEPLTFNDLLEIRTPEPESMTLLEKFLSNIEAIREDQRGEPAPTVKYLPAPNHQIQLNIDKLMGLLFNPRTGEKAARAGVPLYIRDTETGNYKPKKGEIPGQLTFFPVSYGPGGDEKLTLYYALDYDKDRLKKSGLPGETTAEDFFILSVIADAAINGNRDISATKLYKEFTGKEPNREQRTQFVNRLMKMAGTMVDIDDRAVMEAWGIKTYNQYYAQLAPLKFINKRHVVNGGIADGIIKIIDYPDILRTGQRIGQYITVPKSLLYVKKKNGRAIRRTPRFYELLMILLKEIARIKQGKRVNKILYSWIYRELDITEKDYDGREDTLETLYVILDHFKREKWITGYKETPTKSTGETGVSFTWSNTEGPALPIEKEAPKKRRQTRNTNPRH